MTVTVDPLRCGCTGYCVRLAPAARVILVNPEGSTADTAREAAAVCPTNAIVIDE